MAYCEVWEVWERRRPALRCPLQPPPVFRQLTFGCLHAAVAQAHSHLLGRQLLFH